MDQPEQTSSRLSGFKLVSLLTLVSRITGLARDGLMACLFGTGWILDAFTIAFRVPNMFRRLFGEGAMTAAFLPEFVRTDHAEGRTAASVLFGGVARRLAGILIVFTAIAEAVVAIVYLSVEMSDRSTLLCELCLILTPYLILICVGGLYAAALNGVQHFMMPALAPIVLNLVWVAGAILAACHFSTGPDEVRLISAFILFGGVIQLGMVVWKAGRFGIRLRPSTPEMVERTSRIFRAMGPVLIGLSITQINGIVDSLLAWVLSSGNLEGVAALAKFRLPEGTAGALYLGQRLFQFPLGVFAVALGTVLFPRFAKHAQSGDNAELNRDVIHGLQLILVVGIPASVGLWFMAAPITDLLFRYGQFDATAAGMTSGMIAAYGLGVWVYSGLLIINRVFYAANDQMTPMRQGLICVGLNLLFDFVLLPILGGPALPIASVLACTFQLGLALETLRKRFLVIGREAFVPLLWRILICTAMMSAVGLGVLSCCRFAEPFMPIFAYRAVKVAGPVFAAAGTYAVALLLCGISPKELMKEAKIF